MVFEFDDVDGHFFSVLLAQLLVTMRGGDYSRWAQETEGKCKKEKGAVMTKAPYEVLPEDVECHSKVPLVWAGPILRRAQTDRVILWCVFSEPASMRLNFKADREYSWSGQELELFVQHFSIGSRCCVYLIDLQLQELLPQNQWVDYSLQVLGNSGASQTLQGGFYLSSTLKEVAQGSCRRPHSPCGDGLVALDSLMQEQSPEQWPDLLVMTGDQVYVDDVAGPMLKAIHDLIPFLGIPDEALPLASINASELHDSIRHYYQRESLLPDVTENDTVLKTFFGGIRKPIFTTVHGGNHLMSLAEVIAMYLLCWSSAPWSLVTLDMPEGLGEFSAQYLRDLPIIQEFADGLSAVERVFAQIPVAMIFDDHDVTDDWNLSHAWEKAAYNNELAHRVIGNALLGYFLCQGWGNAPEHFDQRFCETVQDALANLGQPEHEQCITRLLTFRDWDYEWPTEPGLVVIDSRTNRWRSEQSPYLPSGLMDWEAITDLQQKLTGRDSVLLVSPAPIFGVKLIEVIQQVFTFFGKPLVVDAENWMAHPGAAYALMNLFRHPRTPKDFIILSGDVHYSFAYKVKLRGHDGGPRVWQITSSGIKNEFPRGLLDLLDRLNRWLYAPWSPLNWLTKRKRMRIDPYRPTTASKGERLLNEAGIGLITISDGKPSRIEHLNTQGQRRSFVADTKA